MTTQLNAQWIVGFVDGEGCFHVAINKNQDMTVGVQVLPEFTVVQHKRDIKILYAFKDFFQCGVVRVNHGDRMAYRVRNLKQLEQIIIPFFEKHPLKTLKNINFLKFRDVVILMSRKQHLTLSGLEEIRQIKNTMNTCQPVVKQQPKILEQDPRL